MRIWKFIALVLLGVLAVALIYPGIPMGMSTKTYKSASGQTAVIQVCHYLYWNGFRDRETDLSGVDRYTDTACWFPVPE